jgi:hypothetical protein
MPRRISGIKRDELQPQTVENYVMRNFSICSLYLTLSGKLNWTRMTWDKVGG